MGVSLSKGGNVNLSKEEPGLNKIVVGLGWDARATDGAEFDLDASAFLVNAGGTVRSDADFIFYNNLKSVDGSVRHTGDNRTGAGDGDDEAIEVDLSSVPTDVQKIAISVTIHEAESRKQNFGMVSNAFVRIVNTEVVRNGNSVQSVRDLRGVSVHLQRPSVCPSNSHLALCGGGNIAA